MLEHPLLHNSNQVQIWQVWWILVQVLFYDRVSKARSSFFLLVSGFISIVTYTIILVSFILVSLECSDSIFLYITNNHHKSSYLPAPYTIYNITVYYNIIPYTIITVLLTIFPLLYISPLWFIYFVTGSLYLINPSSIFTHSLPSPTTPICSLYY